VAARRRLPSPSDWRDRPLAAAPVGVGSLLARHGVRRRRSILERRSSPSRRYKYRSQSKSCDGRRRLVRRSARRDGSGRHVRPHRAVSQRGRAVAAFKRRHSSVDHRLVAASAQDCNRLAAFIRSVCLCAAGILAAALRRERHTARVRGHNTRVRDRSIAGASNVFARARTLENTRSQHRLHDCGARIRLRCGGHHR